jgi:hypothetical protein
MEDVHPAAIKLGDIIQLSEMVAEHVAYLPPHAPP